MTNTTCEAAGGERNPLDTAWACLVCWWKGLFRELRNVGTLERPRAVCPRCGADDLHQADGAVHELPAYYGDIGTRH